MSVRTCRLILLSGLGSLGGFGFLTCTSNHLPANDNGARGGDAEGGANRAQAKRVRRA